MGALFTDGVSESGQKISLESPSSPLYEVPTILLGYLLDLQRSRFGTLERVERLTSSTLSMAEITLLRSFLIPSSNSSLMGRSIER